MAAAGLERRRKHTPVISLQSKSLRPCFSVVVRQKVSCMRDVFMSADAVSWDGITCTEFFDRGEEGVRKKIPCIVLLKKALQASQEATP